MADNLVLDQANALTIPLRQRLEVLGTLTFRVGHTCTVSVPTAGGNPVPIFASGRVVLGGLLRLIVVPGTVRGSSVARDVPASVVVVDSSAGVSGQFDSVQGPLVCRRDRIVCS